MHDALDPKVESTAGRPRGRVSGLRALVLAALSCSLLARILDANPHASPWYAGFVVLIFALPVWFASSAARQVWTRYWAVLLGLQAVVTYLPFYLFGGDWIGGGSSQFGALVLLLLPARSRWVAFAALTVLELLLWLRVGLPYEPALNAGSWVVIAFVNGALSVFALNRAADLLDALERARHGLVLGRVTRQRLAATRHIREVITGRLEGLSREAVAIVGSNDPGQVSRGLERMGRLARSAAADAREVLRELPDVQQPGAPTEGGVAAQAEPVLARSVTVTVVSLFATQFVLNIAVPAGAPGPGVGTGLAAVVVAIAAVALILRHLGVWGHADPARSWWWTVVARRCGQEVDVARLTIRRFDETHARPVAGPCCQAWPFGRGGRWQGVLCGGGVLGLLMRMRVSGHDR